MDRGAEKLLLTVAEAAEALNFGRSFVFELIAAGELESVKVGRFRRIPPDAVEAYVKRLRAEQAA